MMRDMARHCNMRDEFPQRFENLGFRIERQVDRIFVTLEQLIFQLHP
jgi:hypothetical protein